MEGERVSGGPESLISFDFKDVQSLLRRKPGAEAVGQ